MVFGNPTTKIGGRSKREICAKLFGYDFYDFLVKLSNGSLDWDINKRYKNLSALLQREEAAFLDEVMDDLRNTGVPFIPLYDSLIVKKTDEIYVREAFKRVISEKNLFGVITID